ncbi:cytochrome P450 [Actinomycetospora sp. NBRC 106378]|uniref:cytochrome P450 n=1 Tax=Actinomycetospora sp. NBRC 106378 TaxID=3032208 RepID=UPI0024A301AD|nr:cytochrome P450 [Actinomycetospora sp. NBRC 106378]GLZ56362.1 cytochrome P450 [Actinomycetospora sp. NBRC 106378]
MVTVNRTGTALTRGLDAVRSRATGFVARHYLAWRSRRGLDPMSLIPDYALMPLRRDGLDPVPDLREAREDHPVRDFPLPFGVKAWLVTGHEEAREVLGRTHGMSTDFGNLVGRAGIGSGQNPGGLGFTDPPDHTRLRRLLTPEFTGRRLSRLGPRIAEIVDGRLDAMAELAARGEEVDLVRDFATPIPSLTICELLGIPYDERDEFQALSTARFDLLAGATAAFDKISESLVYLRGVVERQRVEPGDGLLGMLIREHGDELDTDELAELADGLLTGGLETSASMLALGAVILLRDPEVAAMVRDEPESVPGFVEELLRYLTVVQIAFPRFATEDMTIGGVDIAEGDGILVSLSAADRDPKLTPNPEVFDPRRPPSPHLAFGHGIHRCIGAELARMELRTAYPALLRRFPELAMAVDERTLPLRGTSIVYGVDALPVTL